MIEIWELIERLAPFFCAIIYLEREVNYMYNPYQPYNNQQIIKVNGINGANAYSLMPNSSCLLLDETAPRLFLAQTDGAGYKTISSYKLEPYVEEKEPELKDILARIQKLEDKVNAKSNTTNAKRKQSTETNETEDADD